MEITWHGNTCFTCREKAGLSVVINPNKEAKNLQGEVILASDPESIPVEGSKKTFDWPGEYEISDIPIVGFQAWTQSRSKEEETGKSGEKTIIFCFQVDGIKICHLGELGHILTSDMVKEIGDVDVLMIKVGKNTNLDLKKAIEVIEAIEPRIVIPMGENNSQDSLLKELGGDKVEIQDKFTIKSVTELPDDHMRWVVLNKS